MESLEKLKSKLKGVEEALKIELSALRIGRATPALVENILVDYYGVISAPEIRLLVIEPWDKNAISSIEKAIYVSDLGLNPIVDKNLIRINIPPLTEERRNSLIKIISVKLEEVKIRCRGARDEAMKEISGSEDEKFSIKESIQKLVDEANKNLENLAKAKEKEIKEI